MEKTYSELRKRLDEIVQEFRPPGEDMASVIPEWFYLMADEIRRLREKKDVCHCRELLEITNRAAGGPLSTEDSLRLAQLKRPYPQFKASDLLTISEVYRREGWNEAIDAALTAALSASAQFHCVTCDKTAEKIRELVKK